MHILITAGPTREYIDAVRYLSNPSSGRMGYALASVAAERGHVVTLVSGPVGLPEPDGLHALVPVVSAADMHAAVHEHISDADAVIMTAAVADWTPASPGAGQDEERWREPSHR